MGLLRDLGKRCLVLQSLKSQELADCLLAPTFQKVPGSQGGTGSALSTGPLKEGLPEKLGIFYSKHL